MKKIVLIIVLILISGCTKEKQALGTTKEVSPEIGNIITEVVDAVESILAEHAPDYTLPSED